MPSFLKDQRSTLLVVIIIALVVIGGLFLFDNQDEGEVTEESVTQEEQIEQAEDEVADLKKKVDEATTEEKEELNAELKEKAQELKDLVVTKAAQLEIDIAELRDKMDSAPEEEKEQLDSELNDKIAELENIGQVKEEQEETIEQASFPQEYTVVKGDHLWKIATNFYDDGYKWTVIASENTLKNPDLIIPGQKLTLPKATTIGKNYTIVKGDTLWDISNRFYGTGFSWTKIRDANPGMVGTLPNGNALIHPGQVFRIPNGN